MVQEGQYNQSEEKIHSIIQYKLKKEIMKVYQFKFQSIKDKHRFDFLILLRKIFHLIFHN